MIVTWVVLSPSVVIRSFFCHGRSMDGLVGFEHVAFPPFFAVVT